MDLKNQTQREIKFRAWDLKKQDWYKPIYEAYNGNLHDISITLDGIVMERTLEFNASMLNSDNYILCQFTGLTDKNGVEIYEWDVINHRYSEKGKNDYIIWDKNIMSFCLNDMSYENWANDENKKVDIYS